MSTRRGFLTRALILAGGLGGAWLLRDQVIWPDPVTEFAGTDSGWLDFATPRDRLPTVAATLNGVEIRALIDSGAQYSALDAELAQRLEAASAWAPPMVAYGAGGNPQMGRAARIDVGVGTMRLPGLKTTVLDLGPIADAEGLNTPLILGHDVLAQMIVEIDVPGRRVRLSPPGAPPPSDASLVPTRARSRALMATVVVEGSPVEVVVDTGASGVLTLGEDQAERIGLLDGRALETGRSVVLGGVIEARLATARTLTLGARTLNDVTVAIYASQSLPGFPEGLLGLGAFDDRIMRLDIGGAGLWTRPAADLTVG